MNFKLPCFLTLLCFSLLNCSKDPTPYEGSLVKRISQTSLNQRITLDSFLYDSQKRLTRIVHYPATNSADEQIEYNAQGRLWKVRFSKLGVEHYSCRFIYNSNGQIIKKEITPNPGFNPAFDKSYTYDNAGRVISDSTYYKQTDSVLNYTTHQYDSKGNITKDEYHNLAEPWDQGKTFYTLDQHPNFFHEQGSRYFFVTDNTYYLNKNNVIGRKPWWRELFSTAFEYQQNGMPKKFTYPPPSSSSPAFEIEYL